MSRRNREVFESSSVVRQYLAKDALQAPERRILTVLADRLGEMRMLDIGVGAGRTTLHFEPLVAEYVGMDYAESMVKACEERFKQSHATFRVADARSMPMFADASVDFVLFSYNGIDYCSHADRLRALAEIRRIISPTGFLVFSSHNLRAIADLCHVRFSTRPRRLLSEIRRALFVRWQLLRAGMSRGRSHLIINDGAQSFGLETYYIAPERQIDQLEEVGFTATAIFRLESGDEVTDRSQLYDVGDPWLYYLCRPRAASVLT